MPKCYQSNRVSCQDMSDLHIYQLNYSIEYLGHGKVIWWQKVKYADSKSAAYLCGTWLKTKTYQTVILAYLWYVNNHTLNGGGMKWTLVCYLICLIFCCLCHFLHDVKKSHVEHKRIFFISRHVIIHSFFVNFFCRVYPSSMFKLRGIIIWQASLPVKWRTVTGWEALSAVHYFPLPAVH